ncbi:MAG: outer membrane beta-barrel protein [Rhodospirillaceae bacterium]|nr:outer membrane beta-barrel protein [Rhodospirillaceae bacterium]
MRKLLLATAAAATIAAVQMPADARADGFYVGVMGGYSWVQDVDGDYSYTATPYDLTFDLDTGYVVGVFGGYGFDFGGRAELEFAYRSNGINSIDYNEGSGTYALSGDLNVYSLMGNFWYDFHTGSGFMPYVGGGIGAAWLVSDDWGFAGSTDPSYSSDSDVAFAYQLGTGVNYAFNETVAVGVGYRFFGTTAFEVENSYPGATNYDMDGYYNHSVLLNLIVNFGGVAD